MNAIDLKDLLAAIDLVDSEITTPEQAREFLRDEGYLNEAGEVATLSGDDEF